jgi:hypothetical protein
LSNKINSSLRAFFLRDPSKKLFWLLLAFALKGVFLLYLISKPGPNEYPGFWGHTGGDTYTYLEPAEHFIDNGKYDPDIRMPGFAFFYAPLYYLFSKPFALNLIILLQWIFSSISVWMLAKTAGRVFNSMKIFHLTYYLFLVSTYSNVYDDYLLSESFSVSLFVFTLYYFVCSEGKVLRLLLSGLSFTLLVFLKPVFAPFLFLFVFLLLIKKNISRRRLIFAWLLPFVLIDGAWLTRNYVQHQKFAPLVLSVYHPGKEKTIFFPLFRFIQSFGGNSVFWDARSELRWFGYGKEDLRLGTGVKDDTQLPDDIYTSAFNRDSLLIVRRDCEAFLFDTLLNEEEKENCKARVFWRMEKYTRSVKVENKYVYYVRAPLRNIRWLIIHSGTYNLTGKSWIEMSFPEKMLKLFYSAFYMVVLLLGLCGMFVMIFKSRQNSSLLLFALPVLYTILIHAVVLRFSEARYFVPVWPMVIVCGASLVQLLRKAGK